VQALKDSELQRARAVSRAQFTAWPANAAKRARQARFLAGRGFSPEVIGRVLRGSHRPDDDPDAFRRRLWLSVTSRVSDGAEQHATFNG